MNSIKKIRKNLSLSQRQLARLSNLSFGTIQSLEKGFGNVGINTLSKVSIAFGYGKDDILYHIKDFFLAGPNSARSVSRRVVIEEKDWEITFFNFIDYFRKSPDYSLIDKPPVWNCPPRFKALLAASIELLCEENNIQTPPWVYQVEALEKPWFVSGIQNLIPSALVESPIVFKSRNVFVLDNFLDRA